MLKCKSMLIGLLVGAAVGAGAAKAIAQCEYEDKFQSVRVIYNNDWHCCKSNPALCDGSAEDVVWTNCEAWEWYNPDTGLYEPACTSQGPQGARYPEADDKAVIPEGHCIRINGTQQSPNDVGILEVEAGTATLPSRRGRVHYAGNNYLKVHCDSIVDGVIVFYDAPDGDCEDLAGHLYIEDTHGDQLQIGGKGAIFTVDVCAKIEGDAELDLRSINGDMTISAENQRSVEISVPLRNRGVVSAGALVLQEEGGTMLLTGADKRGTGLWKVEAGGVLDIATGTEVKGSGTWEIVDDGYQSIIRFNEACLNLTGDFYLRGGLLELQKSICTTGHLLYTGATSGEEYAEIFMYEDTTAKFHGDCP